MVLRTLVDRLSDHLPGSAEQETADVTDEDGERAAETEAGTTGRDSANYAEEIEYGVDESELSDEDVILRLLVKRGGRVNRDTVIDETGWSESRLESVVVEMEADDQISAITVGRKRVICRRGFEPKGYRSHLNE